MNSKSKLAIAVLVAVALAGIAFFARPRAAESTISYSQFLQRVQAGRVADVKILAGNSGADAARVRLKDGSTTNTVLPAHYSTALEAMQQAMVNVEIQDASTGPLQLFINAAPFLILLAVWVFWMTNQQFLRRFR